MLVRTGLYLGGKDVNEFVDKAVEEALKKEKEKEKRSIKKGNV